VPGVVFSEFVVVVAPTVEPFGTSSAPLLATIAAAAMLTRMASKTRVVRFRLRIGRMREPSIATPLRRADDEAPTAGDPASRTGPLSQRSYRSCKIDQVPDLEAMLMGK